MDDLHPDVARELEKLHRQDAELRADLVEQKGTVLVHSAAIARLETALTSVNSHIEGVRKDLQTQFGGLHERIDDAIVNATRSVPAWATAAISVLMMIIGALLEHYGLPHL